MNEQELPEVSSRESDGRTWLTIELPSGASASLSCKSYNDSGETICSQVVKAFAKHYAAPPVIKDYINILRNKNDEAWREARILAQAMAEQSYPDVKGWEMLDDTAGIITQISNMAAGIRERAEAAEAENKRLREVITSAITWHEMAIKALCKQSSSSGPNAAQSSYLQHEEQRQTLRFALNGTVA